MELAEDGINEKNAKQCEYCKQTFLKPYEHEFTCLSCGYNATKRKHELFKFQGKEINIINRLKYAEHKIFCICTEVYKRIEGNDYYTRYEIYQH